MLSCNNSKRVGEILIKLYITGPSHSTPLLFLSRDTTVKGGSKVNALCYKFIILCVKKHNLKWLKIE
jgi:hypothetical protein